VVLVPVLTPRAMERMGIVEDEDEDEDEPPASEDASSPAPGVPQG
jgi:hypothetical protein